MNDTDPAQRMKKMPKVEKVERAMKERELRRFSRPLARLSAAVKVAKQLNCYLSSSDEDFEKKT